MTDKFPWPEDRIEPYTAHRAVGPITVDGRLDERSWVQAPLPTITAVGPGARTVYGTVTCRSVFPTSLSPITR